MKPLSRFSSFGFTLPEMMVGLAIFSLAVIVLTQSLTNVILSLSAVTQQDEKAHNFSYIFNTILKSKDKQTFTQGGNIEAPTLGTVNWTGELKDTDVPYLTKATVKLEFEDHTEEEVIFFLCKKDWMEEAVRNELLQKLKQKMVEGKSKE